MIGVGLGAVATAVRQRFGAGVVAPPPTPPAPRFASFPALRAAWLAGRGLVSIVGDSTSMGWGAGAPSASGMPVIGANLGDAAHHLRAALDAGGVTAVDGCARLGDANCAGFGVTLAENGQLYGPAIAYAAGWAYQDGTRSPFGRQCPHNMSDDGPVTFDSGMTYDRVEIFSTGYPSLGAFSLDTGGAPVATISEDGPAGGELRRTTVSLPATSAALRIRRVEGNVFGLGLRLWASGGQVVQVEPLGVSGWATADWLEAANPYSPFPGLAKLGCHLAIVNLGLNDRHAGVALATYKANLQAIAGALRDAGSDVLLAVPHAAQAGSAYDFDAGWIAAVGEVATALGLAPPVDLRAAGLTADDYHDEIHPNAAGYARIGAAYAARLLA